MSTTSWPGQVPGRRGNAEQLKSRVGFSCFHPLSVREAKVERLVGDKASEQEVGVVVEVVVRLVLA